METTKTEKQNTAAFQLKKLLCKQEKQDLGDKSRWENIPVNYIVTANTLGIELNNNTVKRLNNSEDKDLAFHSIYLAHYFSEIARNNGKENLAKELSAMVGDESIKTEEIAFYAIEAVKNELPKEEQLEKIAKAYLAKNNVFIETLESKVNTLDIVVLPTDKDNAYVYVGSFPESTENLTLNVYGINSSNQNDLNKDILKYVNKNIDSLTIPWIDHWRDEKKKSKGLLLAQVGVIAVSEVAGGIFSFLEGEPSLFIAFSAIGGLIALTIPFPLYFRHKENKNLKSYEKRKLDLETSVSKAKINWIKDDDMEEVYNCATKGKEPSSGGFKNKRVQKAAKYLINNASEVGIRGSFLDTYRQKLDYYEGKENKMFKVSLNGGKDVKI
ncbi:MAG: hypothetical protein ABIB71_07235 [Candidatus Woesearchaeota archaeon]